MTIKSGALNRPIKKGVLYGISSIAIYLLVVVATTPSLSAFQAVSVAVSVNWWVIAGLSSGVAVQSSLLAYAKETACNLKRKREIKIGSGVLSTLASFLSYFVLIPVGCCGTWLYIISFLPGVVGTASSAFLIENSSSLALASLSLMGLSIAYTYLSLRKGLSKRVQTKGKAKALG